MALKPKQTGIKKPSTGPLAESKNWYADRYQAVKVQRNLLALVTVVCLAIALVANLNTYQMAPLKSVQPFVVQTDSVTGLTKVVKPMEQQELTSLEALSESFIVQYVQARESYDYYLYPPNYTLVRLFSDAKVFEQYHSYIDPAQNRESPLNLYGRASRKQVTVKSVSVFLNNDPKKTGPDEAHQAQVRIRTKLEGGSSLQADTEEHLVVWLSFLYTSTPSNNEDRFKNPLGFHVVAYRVDKEVAQ